MATTISSTLLKKWKSIASAVATTHNPGSLEVVTLVHRLGRSPHRVWAQLRSITAVHMGASIALVPNLAVRSWNASQALLDGAGTTAGWAAGTSPNLATFDIYAEFDVASVS